MSVCFESGRLFTCGSGEEFFSQGISILGRTDPPLMFDDYGLGSQDDDVGIALRGRGKTALRGGGGLSPKLLYSIFDRGLRAWGRVLVFESYVELVCFHP